MQTNGNSTFSVNEALNLYQRLRERGQNSTLARLSVEARCGELTLQQRRQISKMLRDYESLSA
jgi:hypothetical protein